jgi:hypothetical protein
MHSQDKILPKLSLLVRNGIARSRAGPEGDFEVATIGTWLDPSLPSSTPSDGLTETSRRLEVLRAEWYPCSVAAELGRDGVADI